MLCAVFQTGAKLVTREHSIPYMSVISLATFGLLSFASGVATKSIIENCLKAKGKWEYKPVPTMAELPAGNSVNDSDF